MSQLDELAARHGISLQFYEIDGTHHGVSDETKRALLAAFGFPAATDEEITASLAAAPTGQEIAMRVPEDVRCFVPESLAERRAWGIALQLYQLRSARNWGIGDFADLAAFAGIAAHSGASFIGTNPLHALFPAEPNRVSPFFPSNRRFLNTLYIAVDKLPGFEPAMADEAAIAAARSGDLVDYAAVARLKYAALRRVWSAWCALETQPDGWSADDFAVWRDEQGDALLFHALFDALSLELTPPEADEMGWHAWPEEYRSSGSPAVDAFARQNGDEIDFHAWLQFAADRQLAAAAEAARAAGMTIGLYLDLAVGEAPDGSATWADPKLSVAGAEIGAPPDYFTKAGQNWGLAGLSPTTLAARGFEPYRALMDAVMRHAGAVRIDHAMGVWQLFFIPLDRPAAEGTYVRFPIEDMLRVIAEESNAFRTIVVGEDLGNVPEGFRDVMRVAGIQSYRILYFERDGSGFRRPENYPANALACLATHDLPTIEGWWRGADIDLRESFGLIDANSAGEQRRSRIGERRELADMLLGAGLIDPSKIEIALHDDARERLPLAVTVAIHRQLALTASRLAAVRIEDLAGETEPVNLPGTIDEYPNWRRKLPVTIEAMPETRLFLGITEAMRVERPGED